MYTQTRRRSRFSDSKIFILNFLIMRVLLIKTSSLGDIIHTFPAITDALIHNPTLTFDWIAEDNFSQIPLLHPAVKQVFPVALRRWRKNLWRPSTWKEIQKALHLIRLEDYDFVIDAQGLLKSSLLSLLTKGQRYGYSWHGARESTASLFYHHKFEIAWGLPAIKRTRMLFAKIFDYPVPETPPNANLARSTTLREKSCFFLPGTSWVNKKWPTEYWVELAHLLKELDMTITAPWSTEKERQEALQIQTAGPHVRILDKMPLDQLASVIQKHSITISGDSGIGYLSAALHIPTLILWGPTAPKVVGQFEPFQHNISSTLGCAPCLKRYCQNKHLSQIQPPCFAEITPKVVFDYVKQHFRHLT